MERIIEKTLEKDRTLRYQSATDLRADLARLKREQESGRSTQVSELSAHCIGQRIRSGRVLQAAQPRSPPQTSSGAATMPDRAAALAA